jgi:hypothetical protein
MNLKEKEKELWDKIHDAHVDILRHASTEFRERIRYRA